MRVAIITDGAASLPDERAEIDNITVVPLRVAIGMAVKEDAPRPWLKFCRCIQARSTHPPLRQLATWRLLIDVIRTLA